MKKIFTFLLIPILFLGIKIPDSFLLNNNNDNEIEIDQNDKIIDLSLGEYHTGMTVDTDDDGYADTLYMWGDNGYGQIGDGHHGSSADVLTPTIITPQDQDDWGGNITNLSLGGYNTAVTIDTNNDGFGDTLYVWGNNGYGQIGNGSTNAYYSYPQKITPNGQSDWNGNIIDLSLLGANTGVTVDTDLDGYADTLYMWGNNDYGQIGDGTNNLSRIPKKITPNGQSDWNGNIIDLSLNTGVTVDTDLDGYADTLYMWGNNQYGEIGNGNPGSNVLTPTIITPQSQNDWGGNIIDLSLSGNHTGITIDTNNDQYADTLYMWGNNQYGELGDGTNNNKSYPSIIFPQGQTNWNGNIIDLSLGRFHTGITVDTNNDGYAETLYMWGNNGYGEIGNGNPSSNVLIPTIITPQGQTNWNGNIINLSAAGNQTGVIIDTNNDQYADALYMWGQNNSGQIGDGTKDNKSYPELISSIYPFFFSNIDFYYQSNNNIEFNLKIDDYQNIINEAPEVILTDNESNNYTTTFISSNSNIPNDEYYYKINGIERGKNYTFTSILINDNQFNLNSEEIQTDYLISDYDFISSTEETETITLNLDQNSTDFNIADYTEDQRKVKVNYTNIDNNVSSSQQFTLDQTNQITLTNLNAETNYRIDSIDYFYEDNNYKYTIEQEIKIFQTNPATPLINADSISLIENSVTTDSFQYTIEIDNLKQNSNEDNFTQYDVNNGIWLIDDNGISYNSSFMNKRLISNGEINGTQNYQLTFLQEDLITGQTYNFTGIGFNDPNGSNPDTITFSSPFEVTTLSINKKFVDNSFQINPDSITTNSFEYTIVIDDLVLIDNSSAEPIFSNFDLNEGLYIKDQNNTYPSSYVNGSSLNLGAGEEDGTVKYQFTFKVNNLKENTTYNFVSLSFTESFEDSIDISENGTVTTNNNVSEQIIIWIIIAILIIFILLILILIWVDLKMKKRTKEISDKLNNYES